jgi:hypothetical protein
MHDIRLLVAGSRTIGPQFKNAVWNILDDVAGMAEEMLDLNVVCVVSGGAKGPDTYGEEWAATKGYEVERIVPDWEKYGKAAGLKRNTLLVDACDAVAIFWDGHSKGTLDTLEKVKAKDVPLWLTRWALICKYHPTKAQIADARRDEEFGLGKGVKKTESGLILP